MCNVPIYIHGRVESCSQQKRLEKMGLTIGVVEVPKHLLLPSHLQAQLPQGRDLQTSAYCQFNSKCHRKLTFSKFLNFLQGAEQKCGQAIQSSWSKTGSSARRPSEIRRAGVHAVPRAKVGRTKQMW